jgi:2-polyprenyl-3-methyl-5-hydroxy-6-metoxy-1,4-benzoquinol methylase
MSSNISYQKKLYVGFFEKKEFEDRLKIVFSWILRNVRKGSKILDVACADGYFSKELVKAGYRVYGCDLSKEILGNAKRWGIKTKVCNLEKSLPYPPEYFDFVFAGEVIEHIIDTDFFLEECGRVLKKGGILIITTPNLASLENRARLLIGIQPRLLEYRLGKGNNGHVRGYALRTLVSQTKEHGLKIKKVFGSHLRYDASLIKRPFHLAHIFIGKILPSLARDIILVMQKN